MNTTTDTNTTFDNWNEVKKQSNTNERKLSIKAREIFWMKLGQNIGSEEYGKGKDFTRPVLIVRKLTHDLFIGIPTTSNTKNNDYFHPITYTLKSNEIRKSSAMILQIRVFSIKRLLNRLGMIDKKQFNKIIEKSKKLIDPT